MTETNTKAQLTPFEAATALAGLLSAYDEALSRKKAAEQALDQAAAEAASTELAQIRDRVRSLMQVIAPEVNLSDSRCRILVVAASRGASPRDLKEIAKAEKASMSDGIVVPAHRYELLSRGRGWARLGSGKNAVWGERSEGGYRLRSEGKWIIGGHDGFSRRGEDVWDVRKIAGVWVANS